MKKLFTSLVLAIICLPTLLNAQCTATINASPVAISNCIGPTISVSTTGTGPFNFVWTVSSPGSLGTPSASSTTVSSTAPGIIVVSVVVIDATFCTSIDSDTIEFVNPVDTFYRPMCSYPDTLCPLDCPLMSLLSWSYIDSTGATTGLTPTASNCVNVTMPGNYRMMGIYETNCTVIHDYIVTNPCATSCSVNIGGDILAISNCMGPSLESSATGSGPITYAWSGSTNVSFMTPTASTSIISASGPGNETIILTATDSTGCIATDTMNITFISPVDTFYSYTCGFPDSLCKLNIPIPFGTVSWSFIDSTGGSTSLGSGNCIAATQNGTYQALAIYETNCTVLHKYIVLDTCFTSIYEHASMVEAGIYPNPANDLITIITDSPVTSLIIWDATGRQVMSKVNHYQITKFTFPITNLLNGSYIVRVQTNKGFVNKRLIKINK